MLKCYSYLVGDKFGSDPDQQPNMKRTEKKRKCEREREGEKRLLENTCR
jgi:hypothetical protein